MTDAIAQLCQIMAEVLRDNPEVSAAELVACVERAIAANPELAALLKTDSRMLQNNRDGAQGFQTIVKGGVANIGPHYHWDEAKLEAALTAILPKLIAAEEKAVDFEGYLQSLTTTYEKWWTHYTQTDVTGHIAAPEPERASPFDFGLMVQTVTKENDTPDRELEKIERLPVLEGIRKYADDHVLLLGRPGSGKSTALIRQLLEEATQALQQGKGQIPVLVELRYWNTSIDGLIQEFLQRHGLTLDDSTLSDLLSKGRFLLLIDGLNELPSEGARTELSVFRRNYPKVPMIFTTRDLGLGGDLGIEKKLEMQPLTEGQMKDFIRAYVPEQAELMLRQLSDRLREFGQTPLLLWMLCEVFQQSPNRQMPTNLAEVFRAFTTMYEDSSVRNHEVALLKGDVGPLSDRRLWKEALKALAALMMQGETPVDFRVAIHRTEAEQELGKLFANEKFPIRDIVDDLLKYHLLQNRTTDQLEFRHQLIQEYYAAEYLLPLLAGVSDDQLSRDYLNLLKWTEPLTFMLALIENEAQALRVVKLAIYEVDLILGAKLAGELKREFKFPVFNWIDALNIPLSLKLYCIAKSNFKIINDSTTSIPILLNALEQEDIFVRKQATEALEQLNFEGIVPVLLSTFKSKSSFARRRIVEGLGAFNNEAIIPILLNALDDEDCIVRGIAVKMLGNFNSEATTIALHKALNDTDALVRGNANRVLKRLNSRPVVVSVLPATSEEADLDSSSYGEPSKELKKEEESSIYILLSALDSKDSDVCQEAVAALGQLNSEVEIFALLEAFDHFSPSVCNKAVEALGQRDGKKVISVLVDALNHKNCSFLAHRRAAETLSKLKLKAAIPALISALDHESHTVRENVVKALGQSSSKNAMQALISTLEDQNSSVQVSAAVALRNSKSEKAVPVLLNVIRKDGYLRYAAADALGNLTSEEAVPALLDGLKDHHFSVRLIASIALGKIHHEMAMPALLEAFHIHPVPFSIHKEEIMPMLTGLETKNVDVASQVSQIRKKMNHDEAIGSIRKAVLSIFRKIKYSPRIVYTDQDYFAPEYIVEALGNLKDETLIDVFSEFLDDEDYPPCVRTKAIGSLEILNNESVIPTLIYALDDEDYKVANYAAKVLGNLESDAIESALIYRLENHSYHSTTGLIRVIDLLMSLNVGEAVIPGLFKYLEHYCPRLRESAIRALTKLNCQTIIPDLLFAHASTSTYSEVRTFSIEVLVDLNTEVTAPYLLEVCKSQYPEVRVVAAKSLGKLSNREAVTQVLFKALKSHYSEMRTIACETLEVLNSEDVVLALLNDAINDENRAVRAAGIELLEKLNSEEITPYLLEVCKSQYTEVRVAAAKLLGKLSNREAAMQALFKVLKSQYSEIRAIAYENLKILNSEDVVSVLLDNAINDENYVVRAAGIKLLGKLNNEEIIPPLFNALEDPNPSVYISAAQALGHKGSPSLLVELWRRQFQQPKTFLLQTIFALQDRCKYYNYEIFHDIIPQGITISLYFSYALADEALQTQLISHLTPLERQGVITSWSSHQILPGEARTQTIRQQINTADIILLLISPDAIADDTCYHLETQCAMERHQSGAARVIPILLRPVDWQGAPFSQLPLLPKNHQPVTTWPNQDQAFQEIAAGIREIALELRRNTPAAG